MSQIIIIYQLSDLLYNDRSAPYLLLFYARSGSDLVVSLKSTTSGKAEFLNFYFV